MATKTMRQEWTLIPVGTESTDFEKDGLVLLSQKYIGPVPEGMQVQEVEQVR